MAASPPTTSAPPERPDSAAPTDETLTSTEALAQEVARLEGVAKRCSNARLLTFGIALLGLLGISDSMWFPLFLTVPALLAFLTVFLAHGRALSRKDDAEDRLTLRVEAESRVAETKFPRQAPELSEHPTPLEAGERLFAPEPECFSLASAEADDLDVISGPRHLFALLDWSSTTFGARRLRYLLLHPLLHAKDIQARQEAVKEFASRDDLRRTVLADLVPTRRHDLAPLTRLLHETPTFAARRGVQVWAQLVGSIAPVFLVALLVSGRLEFVGPLVLAVVLNLAAIGKYSRESNATREHLLLLRPFLTLILNAENALRNRSPTAAATQEILSTFERTATSARRLSNYLSWLAFHDYGVIFEIVNALTLWELRILPPAVRIFLAERENLTHAAGAVGELEALVSLSLPLAERKGFEMPTPQSDERPCVEAAELGHPLLPADVAVRNPLALGAPDNVWILTGSNMSGKSTYIKSVGLNLVLAGAGGPVCARGFEWTPLRLYTDINVRDSLDDGKSYFQVEVERVRDVVRDAEANPRLIALFDELFRGTNADERLAIARALLRHIRSTGALLLVATHDRALADLVTIDGEQGIANRHLRETVEDGVMRFDYSLRDGAATSRNAVQVLEAHGYPANIVEEARRFADEQERSS
jgi:hypothetical protein